MVRHGAAAYQHYYSYGAVMQGKGLGVECLRFVTSEGQDAARALLFLQAFGPLQIAFLPCGFVAREGQAAQPIYEALKAYARAKWLRALFMSPTQLPPPLVRPVMTGGASALLELAALDPGPDGLKAGMHQKWRNRLHKAQRSDLEVVSVPPTHRHAHWLLGEETQQRRQKRYKALEAALPVDLAKAKGQTRAHVCIATSQGEPVSGASFIINGAHATYFSGVTLAKGRDLCAQHLVLFEVAQRLRARGVHTMDLGVIDTHNAPGLARFKLGMGARTQRRSGTFLFV